MHRAAGATEVLVVVGQALRADARVARRAGVGRSPRCLAKLSPVDLVLVEGFKREAHPKLEVYRAAVGKPLLHPEDPHIVAIASGHAVAAGHRAGARPRRYRGGRRHSAANTPRRSQAVHARRCGAPDGAAHRRLLRVRRSAAADRRDRAADRASASRRSPRPKRCRCSDARGRVLAGDVVAPIDLPPFDNSAVDGYAVRHADLDADGETKLAIVDRLTAGHARQHAPSARGEAIRIFTGAPMPHGADTVFMQEDVRARGRGRRRAGRPEARRQPPACRRGCCAPARSCCRRAAGWQPQDVALAAALGLTDAAGAAARAGRDLLDRRRDRRAGRAAAAPPAFTTPTAICSRDCSARLGAEVTDLGILRDEPETLAARSPRPRSGHDLVLTSGGVSTGEADHVRERGRGDRQAGVLARRDQAGPAGRDGRDPRARSANGAAFVGLPGNPVAVFVTFVRVVRPLLLRLAGALPEPLIALPVRAAFAYRRRRAGANMCASSLTRRGDGVYEAHEASAGRRRRDLVADRDRRACRAAEEVTDDRAGRDGRLSALCAMLDRLMVSTFAECDAASSRSRRCDILRRVHIEERIDRLCPASRRARRRGARSTPRSCADLPR